MIIATPTQFFLLLCFTANHRRRLIVNSSFAETLAQATQCINHFPSHLVSRILTFHQHHSFFYSYIPISIPFTKRPLTNMASPQLSDQWDWSFCSSQSFGSAKSIISVNSGLESQVSSNPNAPFEFLHTSESPDAAGTMSSCTGSKDHSSSQHFHPHPTDVNEWVQRQSIATQVPLKSKANSNGLPGATTKLSVPNSEVSGPLSGSLGKWSNVSQHSPSVYDIPTLLEIGTTTSSDHMELRIRPAALAGKAPAFDYLLVLLFSAVYGFIRCVLILAPSLP